MEINASYDPDLSLDYGITVFTEDDAIIDHQFIHSLIEQKILKGVDTKYLPTEFKATIVVKMLVSKSEILVFNNEIELAPECYEEHFINTNLIKRAQENNGFLGFKFEIPNKNKHLAISFALNI